MPYAIVRDTPASWEDYLALVARSAGPAPAGLLLRLAGPTAEGIREIEVWRSAADAERFALAGRPAAARALRQIREPIARSLVVEHVVDRRTAEPSSDEEEGES